MFGGVYFAGAMFGGVMPEALPFFWFYAMQANKTTGALIHPE